MKRICDRYSPGQFQRAFRPVIEARLGGAVVLRASILQFGKIYSLRLDADVVAVRAFVLPLHGKSVANAIDERRQGED